MVLPMNSGFWAALQDDDIPMGVTIDLFTPGNNYFWTTQNDNVRMANSSGDTVEYTPFPGQPFGGNRRTSDMAVATIKFVMANSGGAFDNMILGKEIGRSTLTLRRYFTNSPGLGTVETMRGVVGDFVWNRDEIAGQVRDTLGSAAQQWPYYNYQDGCIWKFGGVACGFDTSSVTITMSLDIGSSTALKIMAVSGSLTQSYANEFFNFGKLAATGGVNSGQVRTVRAHTGDMLLLSHQFGGAVNSIAATVFPGCRKRRIADCTSKYDHAHNFVGWEWIPIQEGAF